MILSEPIAVVVGQIAGDNSDFPAIVSEEGSLSYGALWSIVQSFAVNMQQHGVNEASLVAVNTRNMVVSLATLLASSLLGARYVVTSKVLAEANLLTPTHFFKSEEVHGSTWADFIDIDASWSENGEAVHTDVSVKPSTPWLYLHTSGSTGVPKFFSISQQVAYDRAIAGKIDFVHKKTRYRPLHTVSSRPFFVRALSALINCCTIVDSKSPAFWHRAGVNFVSGSPTQAIGIFEGYKNPHKFEVLELGGAQVTDKDVKRFLKFFEHVDLAYGASETSKTYANICSLNDEGELSTKGKAQGSQFEIVDSSGSLCKSGEIGEVRVKNNYMIEGYLNAPDPEKPLLTDGWFYPGDMARWGVDDALIVVSRTDDVINLGGVKADALLIDLILQSVEGISKAACFKNPKPNAPNELLAFAEFDPLVLRDECIYRAKQACQNAVGIYFTPQRIHSIAEIPRNNKGAVNRAACQKIFLDHITRVPARQGDL